jgi:hypothetical protein
MARGSLTSRTHRIRNLNPSRRRNRRRGCCRDGVDADVVLERHALLDRDEVGDDVLDLLVVERSRELDAPRRHVVPALLDRRVDVGDALDQRMPCRRSSAHGRQVRHLHDRAVVEVLTSGEADAVTPHAADPAAVLLAEQLDRVAPALDRVGLERLLLRQVGGGFLQPHQRHPDHEEDHQQQSPSLELPEDRRLEVAVRRGGPEHPWDVRLATARTAAEEDRSRGDDEEDQAPDRDRDALALREGENARSHQPGATQKGPCGGSWIVSVVRGGPAVLTSEVSTITSPFTTETLNRCMPVGAGPSCHSPASLYLEP